MSRSYYQRPRIKNSKRLYPLPLSSLSRGTIFEKKRKNIQIHREKREIEERRRLLFSASSMIMIWIHDPITSASS
jgi:hypothetical protein